MTFIAPVDKVKEIVGDDLWRRLCEDPDCAGQLLRIPKYPEGRTVETDRRNKHLKARYEKLKTTGIDREGCITILMQEFNVCHSTIDHIL